MTKIRTNSKKLLAYASFLTFFIIVSSSFIYGFENSNAFIRLLLATLFIALVMNTVPFFGDWIHHFKSYSLWAHFSIVFMLVVVLGYTSYQFIKQGTLSLSFIVPGGAFLFAVVGYTIIGSVLLFGLFHTFEPYRETPKDGRYSRYRGTESVAMEGSLSMESKTIPDGELSLHHEHNKTHRVIKKLKQ